MNIGQKGIFRVWGSTGLGTRATVQGHQDAGYLSVQLEDGMYVTFNPEDGKVIGSAPVAGGWERVTFDGGNVMVAQPDGPVILPYEWFSRQ